VAKFSLAVVLLQSLDNELRGQNWKLCTIVGNRRDCGSDLTQQPVGARLGPWTAGNPYLCALESIETWEQEIQFICTSAVRGFL